MQLPGRGRRLSEAPFTELPSLLDAMDEGLRELTDRPYVLFGFSMGAILAFELALRRDSGKDTACRWPWCWQAGARRAPFAPPSAVRRSRAKRSFVSSRGWAARIRCCCKTARSWNRGPSAARQGNSRHRRQPLGTQDQAG
ncbi:alpha/beta fold hydrolase [Verminephrobacter eiseniae]|uniref:thioesterase II family protein n=1 Tax=Verminephrobacter eiseniae TaxID=364317 RepID=UPI002A53684C|nr:alpha/beta fold hydrolase [Verminephrobacter eiseniae]